MRYNVLTWNFNIVLSEIDNSHFRCPILLLTDKFRDLVVAAYKYTYFNAISILENMILSGISRSFVESFVQVLQKI